MPLSQFNVCDLIHTLSQHQLKLFSNCIISVSHDSNVLDSSRITELSIAPTIETVWIARGAGLRLAVTVKLDGISMNGNGTGVFIEQLGLALQNAEFWLQLGLRASLTLPAGEVGSSQDSGRFYLSIVHTETSESSTTLRQEAAAASTRPPDSVPYVELKEIHITWTLFRMAARSPYKRWKPSKPVGSGDVEDELLQSDHCDYGTFVSMSQPTSQTPSLWKPETGCAWPSSQPSTASNLDEMLDDEGHVRFLSAPYFSSSDSQVIELGQAPAQVDLKASRKRTNSDATFKLPDFSASLKLFDASLRYMICNKTFRISPGVKLQDRSTGPKLGEICPALFSPGYLQVMSQRNRFISTIAHSMASIHGQSTSEMLKSTFAQLSMPDPSNISAPREPSQHMSETDLIPTLKARLWILAQKQLYDPKAAQYLKPLTPLDTETLASLAADEMLDEPSSPATLPDTSNNAGSPWLCLLDEPLSQVTLLNDFNNAGSPWRSLLDDLELPDGVDEHFSADDLLLDDDHRDATILRGYSDEEVNLFDETGQGEYSDDEFDLFDELLRRTDLDLEMDREMLSQGLHSGTGDSMEMLDDGVDKETSSMLDHLSI
ncbi:hypothetical protein MMC30_001532 [Trapelia coarctata]|nr:hypothetical protein [Trapelia coarctata]